MKKVKIVVVTLALTLAMALATTLFAQPSQHGMGIISVRVFLEDLGAAMANQHYAFYRH